MEQNQLEAGRPATCAVAGGQVQHARKSGRSARQGQLVTLSCVATLVLQVAVSQDLLSLERTGWGPAKKTLSLNHGKATDESYKSPIVVL